MVLFSVAGYLGYTGCTYTVYKLHVHTLCINYMCLSLYINYMYLLQQVPGYLQLHQVTVTPGYLQLQQVTCSYTWLLTVTPGYLQLQQVTYSYSRLLAELYVTRCNCK